MTATTPELSARNGFRSYTRPLTYLKDEKRHVFLAYLGMLGQTAIALVIPQFVRWIIDSGIGNQPLYQELPRLFNFVSETGISERKMAIVTLSVLLLVLMSLVRGYFTYLSGVSAEIVSQAVVFKLRNQLYWRLCQLSFHFHDSSKSGDLLARATQDVERLRFLCGRASLGMVNALVMMVATAAALYFMNPKLALLSMAILPLLIYQAWSFAKEYRPLSLFIQEKLGELTTVLEQCLRGIRVVQAFAQESLQVEKFNVANREWFDFSAQAARMRSIKIPLLDLTSAAGTVVVIYFGGQAVIDQTITLGELLAFTTYLAQLIMPIRRLGMIIPFVAMAGASSDRVFEILDKESTVQESPGARKVDQVRGSLSFKNVSFNYSNTNRVITDVSFELEPGQVLALLGPTGSGKSTLINLIPRFYDPTDGVVRIDGHNIKEYTLKSLRRQVASVLQDPLLFATTIRENIAFGLDNASENEIIEAAKAAQAHEFIMEMPDQYETAVGEQGVTLSGGQRQRVSIARALITNPSILILDDATSSVDTETEQLIQAALDRLMENRTSIVIAQRFSTVRRADRILLLEGGRVSAFGTHEDLWQKSGLYREIFEGQLQHQ